MEKLTKIAAVSAVAGVAFVAGAVTNYFTNLKAIHLLFDTEEGVDLLNEVVEGRRASWRGEVDFDENDAALTRNLKEFYKKNGI